MAKRGRKKKFKVSFNVSPSTLRSVLAVLLILTSVLVIISFLAPDYFINAKIQMVVRMVFGYSAWIIPAILIVLGLIFIDALKHKIKELRVVAGLFTLLIAVSGFLHLFISADNAKQAAIDGRGGGYVGFFIASFLRNMISVYGAIFVLLALLVVAVILTFNVGFDQIIEFYQEKIKAGELFKFKKKSKDEIEVQDGLGEASSEDQGGVFGDSSYGESAQSAGDSKKVVEDSFKIVPTMSEPQFDISTAIQGEKGGDGLVSIAPGSLPYPDKVWQLPGADLLEDSVGRPPDIGNVDVNKKIIIDTLSSFRVTGIKVVDVQIGPTVTKYALSTPPGVRINQVANLQNDLARALSSSTGTVRIEAPIPGTALIGIEVPNNVRAIVDFKSLITSESMKAAKSKLNVILGTDVGGVTHIYNIAKMPHLLVAGQTGSGKSIFLHNIIMSLLFRATPEEVKFIIVDPKRVELKAYEGIPHLYAPLIVEKEQAVPVFSWAVSEMTRRYKMFESARVSNIEAYNEKSGFQALPYIVIIVDEFTEIMLEDPSAIEKHVVRIAQLARATGIHLVLAAQRPQADVITGLIKANIPCRIAFSVAGMHDSRIIIDQKGAEKLLGSGDMLFLPPDKPSPTRLQGAFIRPEERERVVEFLKGQGVPPEYKTEIFDTPSDSIKGRSVSAGGEERDPFYKDASEIIISAGKGSASLLQRRLSVGYARAARIIDELEQDGIVGPSQGSRAREVLVDSLPMPGGALGDESSSLELDSDPDDFEENESDE